MKVSLITVTYNSANTIERTLQSVSHQTYSDIEYIIIDGASTDSTLDIIHRYDSIVAKLVSEPDRGIYDAINKGIHLATGDIIGLLNSDDILADVTTIETIVRKITQTHADLVYGDLDYCQFGTTPPTIVRHWRSNIFRAKSLVWGWMPPHPTIYCLRKVYEEMGDYDTSFTISADYDFILRVFSQPQYSKSYLPYVMVKMAVGGISNRNIHTICQKSQEDYRALQKNNIGGCMTVVWKNLRKLGQFF